MNIIIDPMNPTQQVRQAMQQQTPMIPSGGTKTINLIHNQ